MIRIDAVMTWKKKLDHLALEGSCIKVITDNHDYVIIRSYDD